MKTLVALLVVSAVAATAAPAAVKPPTRVQVTAKEYRYLLSSRSVKPGQAIVQLVNFGAVPHDLKLRRIGGTRVYKTPIVDPGGYYDLSLKLVPGRYRLWCGVANHAALGMKLTLVVRKG